MRHAWLGLFLWLAASAGLAEPVGKLGVGDTVRVTVFQQPDLTTEARISEQGTIAMPLIGEVKIAGQVSNAAASAPVDPRENGSRMFFVCRRSEQGLGLRT